ncbi:hypothetical protein BDA96_07G112900 [Sorghum bicolor]|uniref:Uncharacterized protein n=2 Tax=Sorghum bicolor TaxID=4558 RepID=A0A921QMD9_SORBI|nr:vegetative cell wall protein gp1 [Sorghum bicolor]KAG0523312.1 hypothetical protein BDA96_07G112900 [Sorghum bicolor]KXG24981.1 hypothetical protein SORBI_3007G106600 [Sorghum bicolor]|eukprot:XP_002445384.2 vegetative cell wall protein gp1 [Sorghum bicolor]
MMAGGGDLAALHEQHPPPPSPPPTSTSHSNSRSSKPSKHLSAHPMPPPHHRHRRPPPSSPSPSPPPTPPTPSRSWLLTSRAPSRTAATSRPAVPPKLGLPSHWVVSLRYAWHLAPIWEEAGRYDE